MNKLNAINQMLSCISQTPLSTLEGNKTARTVMALNILDAETENIQLDDWYFNTEYDYTLHPDENGEIYLPIDTLKVVVMNESDEYTQRGLRLYNKTKHTFFINHSLSVIRTYKLSFDELPPAAQKYITMNAANKFVAKVSGSQDAYAFTQVEVDEAKASMLQAECDTGNYSLIDIFPKRRAL